MSRTLGHLARRLLWAAVIVIGVGTVAFFLSRALPGDPTRMLLGPQARPADVAQARRIYGLDQPLVEQYLRFWARLIHLAPAPADASAAAVVEEHGSCAEPLPGLHVDLGHSFRYRRPVVDLIAEKAPRSIELAAAGLLLQVVFGLSLGILAARWRGTWIDQLSIGVTLVGVSAPTFLLGLILQYVLAHELRWLPFDGYGSTLAEHLQSLVLPALTLGIFGAALYARLSRDELSTALTADYVRTARAKGAGEIRVLVVHGLRNALLPVVTLLVLDFGTLVGGAVVTERLFRWPGMGNMAVDALIHRDGPVIFGTVLFAATAIVLATVLLDVVQVLLDPRLRRSSRAERS